MAPERILVVDDEEAIRQIVRLCLCEEGYEVLEAANGQVALALLSAESVSLILLDLRMPVMDGWEFARRYRRMPGPHAPIVAFVASMFAQQESARIDPASVLTKPFDLEDLLQAVRSALPLPA